MALATFIFGLNWLTKDMSWASSAVHFLQSLNASPITLDIGSPYEGPNTRDSTSVHTHSFLYSFGFCCFLKNDFPCCNTILYDCVTSHRKKMASGLMMNDETDDTEFPEPIYLRLDNHTQPPDYAYFRDEEDDDDELADEDASIDLSAPPPES